MTTCRKTTEKTGHQYHIFVYLDMIANEEINNTRARMNNKNMENNGFVTVDEDDVLTASEAVG